MDALEALLARSGFTIQSTPRPGTGTLPARKSLRPAVAVPTKHAPL
jgi:hypothetical protein